MTAPLRMQDLERHRREEATALAQFPDAPEGSWVSDEGWLITGDEAWTEAEWASALGHLYRHNATRSQKRSATKNREYVRRSRERRKRAA